MVSSDTWECSRIRRRSSSRMASIRARSAATIAATPSEVKYGTSATLLVGTVDAEEDDEEEAGDEGIGVVEEGTVGSARVVVVVEDDDVENSFVNGCINWVIWFSTVVRSCASNSVAASKALSISSLRVVLVEEEEEEEEEDVATSAILPDK